MPLAGGEGPLAHITVLLVCVCVVKEGSMRAWLVRVCESPAVPRNERNNAPTDIKLQKTIEISIGHKATGRWRREALVNRSGFWDYRPYIVIFWQDLTNVRRASQ